MSISFDDNRRMGDAAETGSDPVDVVRRGYDVLSWRYRADDAEPIEYAGWITELLAGLRPGKQGAGRWVRVRRSGGAATAGCPPAVPRRSPRGDLAAELRNDAHQQPARSYRLECGDVGSPRTWGPAK